MLLEEKKEEAKSLIYEFTRSFIYGWSERQSELGDDHEDQLVGVKRGCQFISKKVTSYVYVETKYMPIY